MSHWLYDGLMLVYKVVNDGTLYDVFFGPHRDIHVAAASS